jgi:hypothetical protein
MAVLGLLLVSPALAATVHGHDAPGHLDRDRHVDLLLQASVRVIRDILIGRRLTLPPNGPHQVIVATRCLPAARAALVVVVRCGLRPDHALTGRLMMLERELHGFVCGLHDRHRSREVDLRMDCEIAPEG